MQSPSPTRTKIKITEGHDLNKIKSIIGLKKPMMLMLESQLPNLNERVIEYANYFASDGWRIINTKIIKKYENKKEIRMIQIMLKSSSLTKINDQYRWLMKEEGRYVAFVFIWNKNDKVDLVSLNIWDDTPWNR